MAIPVLAYPSLVQLVVKGSVNEVHDCENVLYALADGGPNPSPGGLTLAQAALSFLSQWQLLWTPFQSTEASEDSCTLRVVDAVVAQAPNRFKLLVTEQWTSTGPVTGTDASQSLNAFSSYEIRKQTAHAGRGHQGHVRIWGIPESTVNANLLEAGQVTAIQTALDAHGVDFTIGAGPFTDFLRLVIMDGKLVNVNPGHPPTFYSVAIEGLICERYVASQITRKLNRRRA